MKRIIFGMFSTLIALGLVIGSVWAQGRIVVVPPPPPLPPPRVVVELPPPIIFPAPPAVIVLPETEVYVVPEIEVDLFFYGGWWWRPWKGGWYRSRNYDSGWVVYRGVPSWYASVYPHWRDDFRAHMWGGHRWDYRLIPHHEFRSNWKVWHDRGYWRDQRNWGTEGRHHHGGGDLRQGRIERQGQRQDYRQGRREDRTERQGQRQDYRQGRREDRTERQGQRQDYRQGRREDRTERRQGDADKINK